MATEFEPPKPSKTLVSWEFPEYEERERSLTWYVVAVPVVAALFIWSLVTRNFLFTVIILFSSALLLRQHRMSPARLSFSISETGVDIHGRHFYPFADLRSFWIVDDDDVRRLYITFKTALRPRLMIPLETTDAEHVRKILVRYLREDHDHAEEPTTDAIARLLKL